MRGGKGEGAHRLQSEHVDWLLAVRLVFDQAASTVCDFHSRCFIYM